MLRKNRRKEAVVLSRTELKILLTISSKERGSFWTQTELAKRLQLPITTLNYAYTKLKARGFLDMAGDLTDVGNRVLRYLKDRDTTFSRRLRAHNIQVVLFLDRLPSNYEELKGGFYRPFTNKRYRGLPVEVVGCLVLLYSQKKAVAVLPDIFANTSEEVALALAQTVSKLIEGLELEYPGLKVTEYKCAKYSLMHVALLDSKLAKAIICNKGHIYRNGRIGIDKSHGRYELEAESPSTALDDIEVLVKYEDLVKENERLKGVVAELQGGSKSPNSL